MWNCEKCENKVCLTRKPPKPCDFVEKLLRAKDGIYRANYIRPRMTGGKKWREIPAGGSNELEGMERSKIDKKSGRVTNTPPDIDN